MADEVQLTGRSGKPWSLTSYVATTVKSNVMSLLPGGEADWPAFEVALRAAVLAKPAKDGKPGLADAIARNPESALVGIVKCAQIGLSLNPIHEHFDLVPRAGVVHGEVRAKGWQHLAMASGAIEFIIHDVVYKQEYNANVPFFDPITRMPNHVAAEFERDNWKDDDVIGAYCCVKLKGQDRLVSKALSRGQINKRRAMAQTDNVWKTWFKEMCIAKADKHAFKSPDIPKTPAMAEALRGDDEDDITAPALTPTRAPLLAAAPTPIHSSPPRKTGGQVMFDARSDEPLPTDEQHRQDLLRAIDTECVNQDISSDTLREMGVKLIALPDDTQDFDQALQSFSSGDLEKLLDHMIAKRNPT